MNVHPKSHSDYLAHHLTESQIDDHLLGDLAAAPSAHLAACLLCAERIAAAADPLSSFQSVTIAWSERRSSTLPIPDIALQRRLWQRPVLSFAACFVFVLGIALTNANRQFSFEAAAPQPVSQEAAYSRPSLHAAANASRQVEASGPTSQRVAQLSADNHMLQAIDAELDTSSDNAAALGIMTTSELSGRRPAISSVQD